nr:unnamed protein product [Digitaria exilis]
MPLQPHHRVITLLLLLLPCGSRADDTTSGSYHGEFVYNGFAGANLTLDGAATVTPDGLLMLTNGNGSIQMMGHALHPSPLPFHNASFSTTFAFAIFGQYEDLSASGLAFVVAADRSVLSTAMPGEFLGLLNGSDDGNRSTHVFAVELDTLFNADLGDMNSNHVGVDVDSLVSTAAESAGYYDDATGVFRNLTLISRKAMQVWVDYDAGATLVTVTMAPLGLPRPKKPLLQTTVDPSDVIVKQGATATAYVGFSSATGMLFSRHFVLGWSLSLHGGPAPELNISELPALPPAGPTKARSSKQVTEMIVIPIASAALVLVVGVAIYAMARRRSKYAELREDWEMPFGAHRFSYRDLFRATRGLHIIRGVASALLYLHEDWEQVVIHRDVKASNVLLDGEMNGRLGDFGLARLYDHGADAYSTHVMGTTGYLAPELGHTGKATPAADVFAFGAFLLEVTCGRRPVEQDEHQHNYSSAMLVDRVMEHLRDGSIVDAVDSRIIQVGGYNPEEVSLVLKLGLLCSHPLPSGRPTMRQVIQYLDGNLILPDLSQAYFSFTEMYSWNYLNHMSSTSSMGTFSDLSGGR